MCAGVGDHDGCQICAVRFALGLHVGHVHIALVVARHHHHLHAHHLRTRWIGAVRRGWNQTDIAMALPFGSVVGTNYQQACVFALATCIGLQANACIACSLA